MSKKIKMPELGQKVTLVKEKPVKPTNLKRDAVNLFNIGHNRKDVAKLLNIPQYKIDYYYYQVFKKGKGKGNVVEPKNKCKLCKKPTEHTFCSKKCYEVYNSEPQDKPKGKKGRPKKVVVELPPVPPVPPKRKKGRPKKEQFVPLSLEEHFFGIKQKKKSNKMAEKMQAMRDARARKIEEKKIMDTWNPLEPNPLDAYTKRTVVVGNESKDEIALEFLNSQVNYLKKQNQKLLEINNKHVLELSKLKLELNNTISEAEYEEEVKEYEELVNNLRNKHANQTNTINELQGVITNLTQEIKNLKEQDITSDELSKKQFEKSMGKKVLNFFIAFMLGLFAAILFVFALA